MRRSDAYEARARELAVAAGQDPNARVERPGLKSMPVWCTYRDAARAEHLAAEAAALVLPPQAPAFQNATLQVFGQHDDATIAQMRNCMGVGNVVAGVVCADGHLGYAQPVGGVIAYERQVSISGVGFDIGCGNMAVRLDTPYADVKDRAGAILDDVGRVISFGIGRRYIAAMQLAGRYSYAGRESVVERVRQIIGGTVTDLVHNHHNYAWRETHDGRDLWVVRKGATPAFPGQRGFVGGSMGDDAVIIEGVDSPRARASLYSTVHGAGRLFGRKQAKQLFAREQMDAWLRERGVLLAGGDLDESPMAYRRLPEVLAQHAGTIRVLHTLRPFAVAMAGKTESDPFRD